MARPPFPGMSLPWARRSPFARQVQEIVWAQLMPHLPTPLPRGWQRRGQHRADARPDAEFCYFSAGAHLFDHVSS